MGGPWSKCLFSVVLFLVFFPLSGMTQQPLFELSEEREMIIVQQNDRASASWTNQMLNLLNTDYERDETSFTILYKENLTITRIDSLQVAIDVSFTDIEIKGLRLYYDFDFKTEFMPQFASLRYRFYEGNQLVGRFDIHKRPIVNDQLTSYRKTFTSASDEVEVVIVGTNFDYSVKDYAVVATKRDLVNEYVNTFFDLDGINDRLESLTFDDISKARVSSMTEEFKQLLTTIEEIEKRSFWEYLSYGLVETNTGHDVKTYFVRTKDYYYYQLQTFNAKVSDLHLTYMEEGLEWYGKGKHGKAYGNFITVLELQPAYSPAQYMLALINYEKGEIEESAQLTKNLLLTMAMDENLKEEAENLAGLIVEDYIKNGLKLHEKDNNVKAVSYLLEAIALCNSSKSISCDTTLIVETIDRIRQEHKE